MDQNLPETVKTTSHLLASVDQTEMSDATTPTTTTERIASPRSLLRLLCLQSRRSVHFHSGCQCQTECQCLCQETLDSQDSPLVRLHNLHHQDVREQMMFGCNLAPNSDICDGLCLAVIYSSSFIHVSTVFKSDQAWHGLLAIGVRRLHLGMGMEKCNGLLLELSIGYDDLWFSDILVQAFLESGHMSCMEAAVVHKMSFSVATWCSSK